MTKEKIKCSVLGVVGLILLVFVYIIAAGHRVTETTDTIMPSVYIVDGITRWPVMLLGLLAETIILKLFLKETCFKSASIALFMNAISAFAGFVTLHLANLLVEVLFVPFDLFTDISMGTFHIVRWICDFVAVIFMNAAIEGLTVKIGYKHKFKKIYWPLYLANAITVIICILFNLYWIEHMFF